MDGNQDNTTSGSIIEQNCRENWPKWTCMFANISGLCSTSLWFIVLLPQVWKNFHRKSVKGLSVLWATANFTASLINLFFVFIYASIPLYGQISSIYCPILEFILMIQFWMYGRYNKMEKIVYATACFLLWAIIIGVELIFTLENFVEYAAIFLWCIETFPQIILNMRLQSTNGQSTGSVIIAMIGKTTDFISTNGLVMPLQYVIMVYFSSSVAYVNGLQVAWYYGNDVLIEVVQADSHAQFWHSKKSSHGEDNFSFHQSSESIDNGQNRWNDSTPITTPKTTKKKSRAVFTVRGICFVIICLLLIGCVAGFVWNINSYFGLLAPVSIMCVLGAAKLYFRFCVTSKYSLEVYYRQKCKYCLTPCNPFKVRNLCCSDCGQDRDLCECECIHCNKHRYDCACEFSDDDDDEPHRSELCLKCLSGFPCTRSGELRTRSRRRRRRVRGNRRDNERVIYERRSQN